MNIFTFLSYTAFLVYLFLGIFVFYQDRRSVLNRFFVVMTACLAFRSITYVFFYAAATQAEALYWHYVSVIAWYVLPGVTIHYAFILAGYKRLTRRPLPLLVIYLPAAANLYLIYYYHYIRPEDLAFRMNWVIVTAPHNTFFLAFAKAYFAAASAICLWATWKLNSDAGASFRMKKQGYILSITLLTSFVLGATIDIVLPLLKLHIIPQMAHIFLQVWMFGIWYAITRYRFMSITPEVAATEILSKITEPIILTDPAGRVTSMNRQAMELLGYSADEAPGTCIDLLILSNDVVHNILRAGGKGDHIAYTDLITKDGTFIPVMLTSSNIFDEWGDLVGFVICGFDMRTTIQLKQEISIRKAAEKAILTSHDELEKRVGERTAELASANERLVDEMNKRRKMEDELINISKLESLGVLAGGIAHDFNNLLAGISNNISVAHHYATNGDGNKAADFLMRAEDVALRAKNLTQQLLTFSKGSRLSIKTLVTSTFLKNSVEFTLSGNNIECQFFIPDDVWYLKADEDRLHQVITNLVINALQAMPGGGKLTILARNLEITEKDEIPVTPGRFVKISICDTGTGIKKEDLKRIFDPYFTTKPRGTGLGLSSVYSIMKSHEGFIAAESVEGAGSTFHLFIPASAEKPAEVKVVESPGNSTGKCRVLIMDDEESLRNTLGELMLIWGFDVAATANGEEAIEVFKNEFSFGRRFDLLIFDLTVPGSIGGIDALTAIRKVDPSIKAIGSSGYISEDLMQDPIKAGFNGFIHKPYKISDLKTAIYGLIN